MNSLWTGSLFGERVKKSRGEGRGRVTPSLSPRFFSVSPNREPVRSYWMKKDRTWLRKQTHRNNSRLFADGVALLQSVFYATTLNERPAFLSKKLDNIKSRYTCIVSRCFFSNPYDNCFFAIRHSFVCIREFQVQLRPFRLHVKYAVTRNKPCTRNQVASEWVKKISIRSWVELHFTTISYILIFNCSYSRFSLTWESRNKNGNLLIHKV